MTTRTWDGSTGAYSSPGDWAPTGVPVAGDTAVITSGTVTVGSSDLAANLTLQFGHATTPPTLTLQDTVIPSSDDIRLGIPDSIGSPASPAFTGSILANGGVENYGTVFLSRSTLLIGGSGGLGGVFTNYGTMTLEPEEAIEGADANAVDQLVNDGVIQTYRTGVFPLASYEAETALAVNVPISGTGTIKITGGINLEFTTNVGAGQTVALTPSSSYADVQNQFSNTLTIDHLPTFAATIGSFGSNETIVVTGPSYDSVQTSLANGTTALTFMQGSQAVGALTFLGSFSNAQFALSAAPAPGGQDQTSITFDSSAAGPTLPSGPVPSVNVYRFFDTTNGTQFLTASASEANSVGTTRPDLVSEGTGFYAVNPAAADANAVQVYRFFDRVDGTHFFTASASERDSLIVTRSDLTYEPSSTFYEHATPQSGDVAVYRFFETSNGTHFYTDSANERAAILASRPDLVSEGVAFYAPSS